MTIYVENPWTGEFNIARFDKALRAVEASITRTALLGAVDVACEIAAYVWETAGIDAAVKVLAREAGQLDAAFGTDWPERVPC